MSDFLVGIVDAGVGPLGGVDGIVEAGGGVEDGARRTSRPGCLELSPCDAVGDDPFELTDQRVDVGSDDGSCIRG
jgi:hypothetical protein